MDEQKKTEENFTSARQVFEHNQKEIIRRKEEWYDRLISSMKLTKGKLDFLIILLIAAVIAIFIFASGKQ